MEGITDESWTIPELVIRFLRAAHELNRCAPAGSPSLTPQQIRAVLYLVSHPDSTLKVLADALSLSETRASRLVEELVLAGHVVRERGRQDRRQIRLHVTPATSAQAHRMYEQRHGALQRALEGAKPEEVAAFARIFARLVAQLEDIAQPEITAARAS